MVLWYIHLYILTVSWRLTWSGRHFLGDSCLLGVCRARLRDALIIQQHLLAARLLTPICEVSRGAPNLPYYHSHMATDP